MRGAIFGFAIAVMLLATGPGTFAPATFALSYCTSAFSWRAGGSGSGPFGSWTQVYRVIFESRECTLAGYSLHISVTITGAHNEPKGEPLVYVFNKTIGLWIMHEGMVTYKYPSTYGAYTVTNYFRGYFNFNGDPSAITFLHGVEYQWIYLYLPRNQEASVKAVLPHARWDEVMQAWLVGFTVYIYDSTTPNPPYNVPFQFVEPVQPSDHNPLNL
jgi:hypothetical protein